MFSVILVYEKDAKGATQPLLLASPLVCATRELAYESKRLLDRFPKASIRSCSVRATDSVSLIDRDEYADAAAEYPHRY
jgi:hypothetical protein